ncbi:Spy/CpxP family protein refolding chaperone [Fibrella forsythiae]|uniref:Periplasmic heavy metal sensor n=1 Tax=Fibrella forsythiae TaxID=2817061 RepID=A0ABS3JI77_9BACT|nr:periplasmic heavy metal sensor [Fibrella forsythiae]MBO0949703.1 periplasmic heavy metal sensor [Fibrella forsythiae]
MNEQRRIRFFLGIIVALVALNIGLLTWIWVRPAATAEHRRNRANSGTFLADTLGFSPQQRQQLVSLQKAYFQQVEARQKPLKQARKAYFHLLDSSLTDTHRRELVTAFHQQAAEIDLITLTHFDRVAAICTPEQRTLLNKLLGELPSRAFRMPRSRRAGMVSDSVR